MKKIPYLLAFYFCIVCLNNSAQVVTTCADVTGFFNHLPSSTVNISGTPGGIFDTIYDRWGNKYNYSEIRINTDSTGYRPAAPSLTCAAGYFNVYFGVNSGMDSPTSPTHLQRRLAVCQVLENISGMVNTALITSTVRVNILVDDILSYYPNAATSGILGVASSYYVYPNNPPNPNPGIVDGQVYKTITTGQNAWNNYGIPLTGGPGFYHGVMSFNFANPSFTWNPTYSVTCPAAEYDLYTICLHELMHSMGFTSLLNYNGVSRMGAANNYYDRYDMFLKNQSPSFSVIASGGTCTPFYNLQYNPAAFLGQGSPSCTNSPPNTTTCSIAVMYTGNSYTVPIYTPQ